ncbi:MAG: hypothetical protein V1835_02370 [Candidatus Micrarchaeota archaeon]
MADYLIKIRERTSSRRWMFTSLAIVLALIFLVYRYDLIVYYFDKYFIPMVAAAVIVIAIASYIKVRKRRMAEIKKGAPLKTKRSG